MKVNCIPLNYKHENRHSQHPHMAHKKYVSPVPHYCEKITKNSYFVA